MSDISAYKGRIIEVIQRNVKIGDKTKVFEIARRAPGIRLIITSHDGKKLLITKEHRHELDGYDYRLPGGKVFDTLEEYLVFLESGQDIMDAVLARGKIEGTEETGLDISGLELFAKSVNGATVEWDLYYLLVTSWQEHEAGQQLEHGEDIEVGWYPLAEVKEMALDGRISEDRSAAFVLRYLHQQSAN